LLISNRWLGCFFRKQSRRICCRFFKHTLHYGQRVFGAGHTVTNRTVILVDLIIITALHIIHCVSLFPSGVTSKLRDGRTYRPGFVTEEVDRQVLAAETIQALPLVPAWRDDVDRDWTTFREHE